MPVHQTHCQKHLGQYLDMKINFKLHIKEKTSKPMKGIGIIKEPGGQNFISVFMAYLC